MSNTTHKSVPLLLSAAGSQAWDSLYSQRGVISAFAEAGFSTAFFSNQRRNGSFIDFLGSEAQEVRFIKDGLDLTANPHDEELVSLLERRLQADTAGRLLVVLHCYGSHFDYRDRYPQGFGAQKDTGFPTAEKKYRPQLVNAYDNTVEYADYVLSRIIGMLEEGCSAVVIFTSDHGEDIYDDDRGRFLHASPIPTYYQLRVPYLVWASSAWRAAHPGQWANIMRHRSSPISTNLVTCHTLLDLAGIRTRLSRPDLALGNDAFAPSQRLYVNDHNEFRALDNCGLKQQDVDRFEARGLRFP